MGHTATTTRDPEREIRSFITSGELNIQHIMSPNRLLVVVFFGSPVSARCARDGRGFMSVVATPATAALMRFARIQMQYALHTASRVLHHRRDVSTSSECCDHLLYPHGIRELLPSRPVQLGADDGVHDMYQLERPPQRYGCIRVWARPAYGFEAHALVLDEDCNSGVGACAGIEHVYALSRL